MLRTRWRWGKAKNFCFRYCTKSYSNDLFLVTNDLICCCATCNFVFNQSLHILNEAIATTLGLANVSYDLQKICILLLIYNQINRKQSIENPLSGENVNIRQTTQFPDVLCIYISIFRLLYSFLNVDIKYMSYLLNFCVKSETFFKFKVIRLKWFCFEAVDNDNDNVMLILMLMLMLMMMMMMMMMMVMIMIMIMIMIMMMPVKSPSQTSRLFVRTQENADILLPAKYRLVWKPRQNRILSGGN